MSVIEEIPTKTEAKLAETHLYASPYRCLYIGRLGPCLHIKKASSVLIVGLEHDLVIDVLDAAGSSYQSLEVRSLLIPAETKIGVHTGNRLIGIFVLDYLGRDLFTLSQSASSVRTKSNEPVYIGLNEQDAFITQINKIYRNQPAGQKAINMLMQLYAEKHFPRSVDPRIENVVDYIKCGRGLNQELPELAACANLSVPRFCQLFKQTTGTNVRRFKLWCRQYLIIENLAKGLSFSDAAYAAGYADYSHFSRSFLEMSGINPSTMFSRAQTLHLDVFRDS